MARDFQTTNVVFTLPRDPAEVARIDKPLGLFFFLKKEVKIPLFKHFS
jgi:hypothetical protein